MGFIGVFYFEIIDPRLDRAGFQLKPVIALGYLFVQVDYLFSPVVKEVQMYGMVMSCKKFYGKEFVPAYGTGISF